MIWMDVDAALSEVPVNIAPLIDDTDFKSVEASIAYNAGGMALKWNFVTTAGAYTQTAVTPTTGGDYDWTSQGNGMYSLEIPASGGASINNDTEGFGWFSGVATGVLPWRGPVIGFRASALNNSMVDGTTIDVNVTAIANGAITAAAIASEAIDADAIKADAVTEIQAGLATSAQVAGIGSAGGAAINVDVNADNASGGITGVTSGTTKVGTQTGTYASTSILDGTVHSIAHSGSAIDWVYQFLTGAGTMPISITWTGYFNPITKTMTVQAWNHVGGAWETIGTIAGQTGSTNAVKNLVLYSRHRGTSTAELGKVYLRFVTADGTTLATDQVYLSYAMTARGTYSDGAVWLNTNASNTNTQSYVDGVPENPVSTIAAALTIGTALNLKRYRVANGSAVTFAASFANRTMIGHGYTLALGGQDISGAYLEGVEGLSGTGTCATGEAVIKDCHLGAVTIGEADFVRCHLNGTVTLSQASVPYRFHDCTGITSAKIAFNAASQTVVVSQASGTLTVASMGSGHTLYVDGNCDLTLDNTNTGGTVYISGAVRLTNSGTGQTINDTARWDEGQNVTNVTGTIAGIAANAITATAIQDGAITNAKVADDVDVNVKTITADAITATAIQNGAITNAKVADDVDVNVKTITAGAITAAAIATDAIDADALATDALTEIANAAGFTLKKNTEVVFPFVMTDSTNHAPATGKTVTATVSKDGGSFTASTNSASEIANGAYKITLTATEMNATSVQVRFTATGCDDQIITIFTQG